MIATRQLSHRVPQLRINGMRKALILACSFATIATPALAVDPAKVAVMVAQMRADEQTAIEPADKAEVAAKLALQAKGRIEAFQLADKVIEQTEQERENEVDLSRSVDWHLRTHVHNQQQLDG
jgi:hypothetical protein